MKQLKKPRKKPVGTAGLVTVDHEEGSAPFEPIAYGETQEDVEEYVMNVALESARRAGAEPWELTAEPLRNPENDFDFTLTTRNGQEYIDLMEVAPLEDVWGSHEDAVGSYRLALCCRG